PGEEAEPLVLVLLDQVSGDRRHAPGVVAEEDVHSGLVPAAGDDDDRYLGGQRVQLAVAEYLLGDDEAVHLAGQRAHPLLEQLTAAAEGQQQGVLGPAEHSLGRVHDVVDEQQAAALDVDLVGAPLQAHEPDDVLAPPGKTARRRVGYEAERLDDGEHPLAGIRVDQVRAAQHPGNGGDRHPRHLGDVIDRGHAELSDMIRADPYDDSAYIASYVLTLRIDVSAVNSWLGPLPGPSLRPSAPAKRVASGRL